MNQRYTIKDFYENTLERDVTKYIYAKSKRCPEINASALTKCRTFLDVRLEYFTPDNIHNYYYDVALRDELFGEIFNVCTPMFDWYFQNSKVRILKRKEIKRKIRVSVRWKCRDWIADQQIHEKDLFCKYRNWLVNDGGYTEPFMLNKDLAFPAHKRLKTEQGKKNSIHFLQDFQ
mmetsp:Transcript_4682/g.6647  ORF Transcript_4682/g.6647 Transcript_4682/m.6647 type:complete len:175 (-) Transcript_4682:874-1398(-)